MKAGAEDKHWVGREQAARGSLRVLMLYSLSGEGCGRDKRHRDGSSGLSVSSFTPAAGQHRTVIPG